MAIPAFALPLLQKGLGLVTNAAMAKGQKWLEDKTGLDLSDTENLPPEAIERLKIFEKEHEAMLLNILKEDRESARKMQSDALEQNDLFSKRFIYYFAIFWSLFASLYIAFITFGEIPVDNVRFADTVLGFLLGTIVATIIAFFYGASAADKSQDSVIEELLKRKV
jgi:hypothetical protein